MTTRDLIDAITYTVVIICTLRLFGENEELHNLAGVTVGLIVVMAGFYNIEKIAQKARRNMKR